MSSSKTMTTTQKTNESSTSSRSAKKQMPNKLKTRSEHAISLPQHSMVESKSVVGSSPLNKLYETPEFVRGWHNDVSFHVAENALHLRKFRKFTQAEVANLMETSQSAIARIEGGDENITLSTLKRLITTLRGRLFISFPPEELARPQAQWWKVTPQIASASTHDWTVSFALMHRDQEHALLGFERQKTIKTIAS